MNPEPPPKAAKGLRVHVEQLNRLRDYAIRHGAIPQHGHQQTPHGVLPPPQSIGGSGYVPQFFGEVFEEEGSHFFRWARGGVVMLPFHDAVDSNVQTPAYSQVPVVPVMGDSLTPITDWRRDPDTANPVLTLSAGSQLIVLKIKWTSRDEETGSYLHNGAYKMEADTAIDTVTGDTDAAGTHTHPIYIDTQLGGDPAHAHTVDGDTEDSDPATHTHGVTGSFDGKIVVPILERNFAFKGENADDLEIILETVADWEARDQDPTTEEEYIPLLQINLVDGISTIYPFHEGGAIWRTRPSIIHSSKTDPSRETPTPGDTDFDDHKALNYELPAPSV